MRQHPNDLFNADGTPKPVVPGESRRGMGISPWEQAILGNRHARNERIAREHQKIFKRAVRAGVSRRRGAAAAATQIFSRHRGDLLPKHRYTASVVEFDAFDRLWKTNQPKQSLTQLTPGGLAYSRRAFEAADRELGLFVFGLRVRGVNIYR